MKRWMRLASAALASAAAIFLFALPVRAAEPSSGLTIQVGNTPDTLKLLFALTILSLAPSILIMMTGFTRIIIVLSCTRNAVGLSQTPPNQVLIGLALFLTLALMNPIISQINEQAYTPYVKGEITQEEALNKAAAPLRTFMLKQTYNEDLTLFLSISNSPKPQNPDEIGMTPLIPAFITSELKRAFIIGFLIYMPFLIIDMVVASILMSMGMVMLSPAMISLPFKIMLFVLVDGWDLVVKTLILSFKV